MAHDTEAQPWAWVVRGVGGDSECDLEGARNEGGSECDLRSRRRATWNGGTGRLGGIAGERNVGRREGGGGVRRGGEGGVGLEYAPGDRREGRRSTVQSIVVEGNATYL